MIETTVNFNQVSIWQYVDKDMVLSLNGDEVILHHDGKWTLRKYEEGKKKYLMDIIFESDNIFDFCYWLNSQELTL